MAFGKKGYIAKVLVLYILLTGDILCNALAEDTDDNQFVYTGFVFPPFLSFGSPNKPFSCISVMQSALYAGAA